MNRLTQSSADHPADHHTGPYADLATARALCEAVQQRVRDGLEGASQLATTQYRLHCALEAVREHEEAIRERDLVQELGQDPGVPGPVEVQQ